MFHCIMPCLLQETVDWYKMGQVFLLYARWKSHESDEGRGMYIVSGVSGVLYGMH